MVGQGHWVGASARASWAEEGRCFESGKDNWDLAEALARRTFGNPFGQEAWATVGGQQNVGEQARHEDQFHGARLGTVIELGFIFRAAETMRQCWDSGHVGQGPTPGKAYNLVDEKSDIGFHLTLV